jgi:hypothetical protein
MYFSREQSNQAKKAEAALLRVWSSSPDARLPRNDDELFPCQTTLDVLLAHMHVVCVIGGGV